MDSFRTVLRSIYQLSSYILGWVPYITTEKRGPFGHLQDFQSDLARRHAAGISLAQIPSAFGFVDIVFPQQTNYLRSGRFDSISVVPVGANISQGLIFESILSFIQL